MCLNVLKVRHRTWAIDPFRAVFETLLIFETFVTFMAKRVNNGL